MWAAIASAWAVTGAMGAIEGARWTMRTLYGLLQPLFNFHSLYVCCTGAMWATSVSMIGATGNVWAVVASMGAIACDLWAVVASTWVVKLLCALPHIQCGLLQLQCRLSQSLCGLPQSMCELCRRYVGC